MYALIDCNNFYASCEQVFNPKLKNTPIVVLSNNDGCVIARSKEAKLLDIPMGAPAFMYKNLFEQHKVLQLSSNFPLYGDMSNRVIETIRTFSLPTQIYSIDEVFISLPIKDPVKIAFMIRNKVLKWTGIEVSVGIGPTKTLSKVANKIAKKGKGVVQYHHNMLNSLKVEDIWGVGKRFSYKLKSFHINYANQLVKMNDTWIKKHFTIVGLRTVFELRGTPCLDFLEVAPSRKSIVSSQSFGKATAFLEDLKEAIATYAAKGAKKMRKLGLKTHFILVFITNKQRLTYSANMYLPAATNYTPRLIDASHMLLLNLFSENMQYKKGGVLFGELTSQVESQIDAFSSVPNEKKLQSAIHVFDNINALYGANKMIFASEGIKKKWKSASSKRSPRYTTNWNDIPSINLDNK